MTATCPQGHASEATDYCDVCGILIDAAASQSPAAASQSPAAAASAVPESPAGPPSAELTSVLPIVTAETRACPACGHPTSAAGPFCEECGANMADPNPVSRAVNQTTWEAVVSADRAYFDRMEPDGIDFPVVYPERRFPLSGPQVLIGRRSASRGIEPEIDLAVAPVDSGISHQHAVLVEVETGWAVVDPGSTNGTYLNGSATPLPNNEQVPLADGDRIQLGAWTTITVRRTAP